MKQIEEARELLAFNETSGTRYFRVEGNGPQVDITEELNQNHRTAIDNLSKYVRTLDDIIASSH